MNIQKSIELFTKANTLLPGGVDSPARAFRAVGGQPLFIDRGEGAYLVDVDGNRFVDYMLSFGPLIRGHAHPEVVAAIQETAAAVGIPIQQTHVGTMLCTFFTNQPVTNWESVSKSDTGRFAPFFQALLTNGVYLPPQPVRSLVPLHRTPRKGTLPNHIGRRKSLPRCENWLIKLIGLIDWLNKSTPPINPITQSTQSPINSINVLKHQTISIDADFNCVAVAKFAFENG